MTAAMSDLPPAGGWTNDDLDALPEDGVRRELLDGVLLVSPAPSPAHQVLAARLLVALEATCPEHYHVSQSNDVVLSTQRRFVPDVLVTSDEAAKRNVRFTADEVILAVEIVSPSSLSMDWVTKPALYARAGIPFYWVIETANGLVVHTFKLDSEDAVYQPAEVFTEADMISLDKPWRIQLPVAPLRPRHL